MDDRDIKVDIDIPMTEDKFIVMWICITIISLFGILCITWYNCNVAAYAHGYVYHSRGDGAYNIIPKKEADQIEEEKRIQETKK